jgi:hypothetical protein
MRILVIAAASAALVASAATVTLAQNAQTETSNPNTKVYAYQKNTAPKKTTPGAAVSMAGSQNEHLPASAPFGSPRWWDIMGRQTTNGEGSQ